MITNDNVITQDQSHSGLLRQTLHSFSVAPLLLTQVELHRVPDPVPVWLTVHWLSERLYITEVPKLQVSTQIRVWGGGGSWGRVARRYGKMLDYYKVIFMHNFSWLVTHLCHIRGTEVVLIFVEFQYFQSPFFHGSWVNWNCWFRVRVTCHWWYRVADCVPLLV